ncbi:MAG TPA: alpha-glucosidase/alpha-galactosidase [Planctomycetota bacterium]|nr:alpha-glucosidase/alpha-galactosidase [Planctomycetota bacterium]
MIKVAMIGAGSVVFSKNLTGDILGFPEFKNATFSYMDIDKERLEVGAALCRKVAKAVGANPKIEATTDRKEALRGADFVINMVQIGGFDSTLVDFEIPRKYGLNFTIADTTGPGGLFRALRTFPMLSGLARDMEEVCPRAVLLNYSNPMSMNMQTITRTSGIQAVGLCHSVQGTFNQLMGYIKEDPHQVAFTCAGINHMAFYTKIEKKGVDLYPRLFEAMNDPKCYATNKVRFELMRRLGYFVTESSEHNAEYCPYFIPHGKEEILKYDVPIDEYLRRCDGIVDEFERMKTFSKSDAPMEVYRSHEYGSTIIHSITTGTPSVVYGNMPNNGAITNLPKNAIAEVPTLVDRSGLQFTTVGELPPQLIGYIQPHVTQHELFIRAAMEGRRDHVYQAAMFDPLTAATLKLDKIVEMCDELIAGHGDFLPKLEKKSLVPTSGKSFGTVNPKDLRASWDAAALKAGEDAIHSWHVIGPVKSPTEGKVTLELPSPIEDEFLRRKDGSVDLKAKYDIGGQEMRWAPFSADKKGLVNLSKGLGRYEWSVGYAYAEIESIHARETVLSCGSDDGIKIWLNGKVVHQHEVGRALQPNQDNVPIRLQAGVNRIIVKIDNYVGGWGFTVSIPKANF